MKQNRCRVSLAMEACMSPVVVIRVLDVLLYSERMMLTGIKA